MNGERLFFMSIAIILGLTSLDIALSDRSSQGRNNLTYVATPEAQLPNEQTYLPGNRQPSVIREENHDALVFLSLTFVISAVPLVILSFFPTIGVTCPFLLNCLLSFTNGALLIDATYSIFLNTLAVQKLSAGRSHQNISFETEDFCDRVFKTNAGVWGLTGFCTLLFVTILAQFGTEEVPLENLQHRPKGKSCVLQTLTF